MKALERMGRLLPQWTGPIGSKQLNVFALQFMDVEVKILRLREISPECLAKADLTALTAIAPKLFGHDAATGRWAKRARKIAPYLKVAEPAVATIQLRCFGVWSILSTIPYSQEAEMPDQNQQAIACIIPLHHTWLAEGEATPIVLIHGFGSSISGWQPFLPQLPSGHPVLAIDLPGHGRSPMIADVSFGRLVDSVARTIEHAGVAASHLIGHSLGGAIAAHVAISGICELKSLTLISTAGLNNKINSGFMERYTDALTEETLLEAMMELVADPSVLVPTFVRSTLRQRRDATLMPAQRKLFEAIFPQGRQPHSILPCLKFIDEPINLVFGDLDTIIDPPQPSEVPSTVRYLLIEGAGHLPYIEFPDQVGQVIRGVISRAGCQ